MAEEKLLGKIDFAEYGTYPDRPFLFGLQLGFSFNGRAVMDGGRYTINISEQCRWEEGDLIDKDVTMNAILSEPTDVHYPSWYASIVNDVPAIVPGVHKTGVL